MEINAIETRAQAAMDYAKNIQDARDKADAALKTAKEAMKLYADKHRGKKPDYQVGDQVMLDGRNLTLLTPSRKLSNRNLGPFKVIKKHGELNYELELPPRLKIHPVFYAGLLIPYRRKTYPGRPGGTRPGPAIVNDEEEYEVESILDSDKIDNEVHYLVKWIGYPNDENTWEPLAALENAAEYVDEYHTQNPGKAKPRGLRQWLANHA